MSRSLIDNEYAGRNATTKGKDKRERSHAARETNRNGGPLSKMERDYDPFLFVVNTKYITARASVGNE
jgi:hypothetical protein